MALMSQQPPPGGVERWASYSHMQGFSLAQLSDEEETFAVYHVVCSTLMDDDETVSLEEGYEEWTVFRRYAEFRALKRELARCGVETPELPPRRLFSKFSTDFLTKRAAELSTWLVTMTRSTLFHPATQHFLTKSKNRPPRPPLAEDVPLVSPEKPQLRIEHPTHFTGHSIVSPDLTTLRRQKSPRFGATDDASTADRERGERGGVLEREKIVSWSSASTEESNGHGEEDTRTPRESNSPLDKYELLCLIGRGGFGTVYLIEESSTRREFALKILNKSGSKARVRRHMLEREILGTLHCPFIVQLHEAFQSHFHLFLVMELCPGGELDRVMRRIGVFTDAQSRFYAAEIVLPLAYMHDRGYVFRDLKPENVLLTASGHVKLADFGLAARAVERPDSGVDGGVCGTAEYMAPEVARAQSYGTAVDVWALGCIVWEMCAGSTPFTADTRYRLHFNIQTKVLFKAPNMSESLFVRLRGFFFGGNAVFAAQDFATRTLDRNPRTRPGVDDLRSFDFFLPVNWADVERFKIQPPFQPSVDIFQNFNCELPDPPRQSQAPDAGDHRDYRHFSFATNDRSSISPRGPSSVYEFDFELTQFSYESDITAL